MPGPSRRSASGPNCCSGSRPDGGPSAPCRSRGARTARRADGRAARLLDQEVAALLTSAETQARDLLTRHREALNQLTAALMEQETITGDQVRALVHTASPALRPAGTPAALPSGAPARPASG
jgi:hypothetical protein